jgi:hypothetical protein
MLQFLDPFTFPAFWFSEQAALTSDLSKISNFHQKMATRPITFEKSTLEL